MMGEFDMIPRINGATQLIGIVGDPVRQVRSPEVWCALFRHNGVNAVCVPMQARAEDLQRLFAGMRGVGNLIGMIVTIPHKQAAMQIADAVTERARHIGAANVLRPRPEGGWFGDIVDGVGFIRALKAHGQRIAGRRALVVGSGGVGTAIAFAIAGEKPDCVGVADIAPERAQDLAARIQAVTGVRSFVAPARAEGFDLVVNASPMGMREGDPLPIDCQGLTGDAIAADVVVLAELTPFLAAARERGCFVQPGSHMTDHQIEAMAEFFGVPAGDWSPEAIQRALGA